MLLHDAVVDGIHEDFLPPHQHLTVTPGFVGYLLPTTAMVALHWHKAPPHDMPVFFSLPAAMGIGVTCLLGIGAMTIRVTRQH